jgi:hypothetical protein
VAVGDINGDNSLDIVFGTGKGNLIVLNGNNGSVIWDLDLSTHIGKTFDINHAPLIADFDQDGKIDIFIVGGKTDYPNFQTNYGRAYMITAGIGNGPDWLMFQHDLRRKSSMCDAPLSNSTVEKNNQNIQLYPNPSREFVTLVSSNLGTVTIRTITGSTIKSFELTELKSNIAIGDLAPGLYIVSVQTKQGMSIQKLQVE